MRLTDAIELLSGSGIEALGPTTWADLGCGSGTFTVALAASLAPGSAIHAMDRDRLTLGQIPSAHNGVRITTHRGDFMRHPWPFDHLDGILMANALHYVADQPAFIRACERSMTARRRFLIVEYETNQANRWVPYPVNEDRLRALFAPLGYSSIAVLNSRPSIYQRAPIYAAVIALE